MVKTTDSIRVEEINVERKIDEVGGQIRNMEQIEDDYSEFFHSFSSYSSELMAYYGQSKLSWVIEDQVNTIRVHQRNIFDSLEGDRRILSDQQRVLEDERNELEFARKKMLLEEEDAHG